MSQVSIYCFVFAQLSSLMTSKISIAACTMSGSVAMKSGQVTSVSNNTKDKQKCCFSYSTPTHIFLLVVLEFSYIFSSLGAHLTNEFTYSTQQFIAYATNMIILSGTTEARRTERELFILIFDRDLVCNCGPTSDNFRGDLYS